MLLLLTSPVFCMLCRSPSDLLCSLAACSTANPMRHAKTFLLGALLVALLVAPVAWADDDLDME